MFLEYVKEVRPDLSDGSQRAYSTQLGKVASANYMKESVTPLFFIQRLANKSVRDKTLSFITDTVDSLQSKNMRLSAVKVILIANKPHLEEGKYRRLLDSINTMGKGYRESINEKNGMNLLTEKEEEAFKTTWEEIAEYASSYHSINPTSDRDWIMLNLVLNNYEEKDGIKYNVLLRTVEYAGLHIWNYRKKPPNDHKNYIWIPKRSLYIQHSKTTGGIKAYANGVTREQIPNKTYPIREELILKIMEYIKHNKLKHTQPLFYGEIDYHQLSANLFGKIFKRLLTPLNPHLTIGMVRKIYSNRPLPELNQLVDHTMETESAFYKKKTKMDYTLNPIEIDFV